MTQAEARERLVTLAGMVALEAPQVRNKYVHDARVPWAIIEEIRETMIAAGINYTAARERFVEIKAACGYR